MKSVLPLHPCKHRQYRKQRIFEELLEKEETAIRDKVRITVKEMIAIQLKDMEVSSDFTKDLETKLIDDMEELVQDKFGDEAVDLADGYDYENQLYFGSEMIYYEGDS